MHCKLPGHMGGVQEIKLETCEDIPPVESEISIRQDAAIPTDVV